MRKLLRWADRYEIPYVVVLSVYFSVFMWILFEDIRAVMLYFVITIALWTLYVGLHTIYSFAKKTYKGAKRRKREKSGYIATGELI